MLAVAVAVTVGLAGVVVARAHRHCGSTGGRRILVRHPNSGSPAGPRAVRRDRHLRGRCIDGDRRGTGRRARSRTLARARRPGGGRDPVGAGADRAPPPRPWAAEAEPSRPSRQRRRVLRPVVADQRMLFGALGVALLAQFVGCVVSRCRAQQIGLRQMGMGLVLVVVTARGCWRVAALLLISSSHRLTRAPPPPSRRRAPNPSPSAADPTASPESAGDDPDELCAGQ